MRDVLETLLPALLIVLVVNAFLAQATRVEGQSMEPNLHDNQRLVIEKISYRFHTPQRGDIVVLKSPKQVDVPLRERVAAQICALLSLDCSIQLPGETIEIRDGHAYVNGHALDKSEPPLIKRVIALPGETLEVRDGHVYINGQLLEESYLDQMTSGNVAPVVVSPESVFVLGDNRGASNDSRSFGEVELSDIIGRAWLRYWPPEEMGVVR